MCRKVNKNLTPTKGVTLKVKRTPKNIKVKHNFFSRYPIKDLYLYFCVKSICKSTGFSFFSALVSNNRILS